MGVNNHLIFGGIDSADYGVQITGSGTFSAPERDVEYVSVPGRNGDLLIDNGKWNNIDVTYPANVPFGLEGKLPAFRAALCRQIGYQRLEDSYHPNEYRMAAFTSGMFPETTPNNRGADFDIVFNCKPQRFLKSGEQPIKILPPTMSGSSAEYSQYIEIGADYLEYELEFKTSDTVTLDIYVYDVDKTLLRTASSTHTGGSGGGGAQFDLETDVYVRFHLSGFTDADKTKLIITEGATVYEKTPGRPIVVDLAGAVMCRTIEIENPTGYETTPMIEFFREVVNGFSIENYVNGVRVEYYDFHIDDTGKKHFYMDCETQYLYDDAKNNLTNKLTISTAESDIGKALVFPTLGTEKIVITATMTTSQDLGSGLVNIYPGWWSL